MLPKTLLTHRATVTQQHTTGDGSVHSVSVAVSCHASPQQKTTMTSDGPVTKTLWTLLLPADVTLAVGDAVLVTAAAVGAPATMVTIRDLTPTVGPHGALSHYEAVAW